MSGTAVPIYVVANFCSHHLARPAFQGIILGFLERHTRMSDVDIDIDSKACG